ncbi:OmpP1/FadL family transporter [Palleronia pelagia]|uniref:Long-chain fatty acid transport protein n=1 Tax=Palleronia pelagia TaxID=387096 RepID=A0A1H8BVU4_9RHOB|nr:outer membrane protein transport protein [Palleronia pelagia]SEM86138.1 Long-chain fatty acid transport protein [Palleronia pelagia]
MKKLFGTVAVLALAPAMAGALGLDRSGQPVTLLFEDGNYAELSFGRVFPSVDGNGNPLLGGGTFDDVGDDYSQLGAGVKLQLSEQLSFALTAGQPYGVDIAYPGSNLTALGGTAATLDSSELMALARYEFSENISVHGGLRYVRLGDGNVTLSGNAYGAPAAANPLAVAPAPALNGYNVQFGQDSDIGLAIGAAYERPEIALRIAMTYFTKTDHDLPTVENVTALGLNPTGAPSAPTQVQTPEAINLDFQTGLNQQTLLFGQIRYAWYDDVKVTPAAFGVRSNNSSLTSIDDAYSVSVGIGRQLTDRLSGSVTLGYERQSGDFGSPLAPTDGQKSIGLGLSYDVNEQFTIAGGVRYVDIGDATPSTGVCDVAGGGSGCASFSDNSAVAFGFRVGYSF